MVANLTGTSFNVVQEPLDVGDTFTVNYTIANTGTTASGLTFTDFRLSTNDFISTADESLGAVAVGGIAPGSSTTSSWTFTLPGGADSFWDTFDSDGNYAVGMIIDSTNLMPEINENDNRNVGEFDDYDTLDIDDAYENNNTRLSAYDIGNRETVPLSNILGLGHSFNDDWYEINVTNGFQRLVVDLSHTHSQGNLDLGVYDSAGTLIHSSTSFSNNEQIDTLLANGGTHYLRVYNPGADTGQSYDLEWDDLPGTGTVNLTGTFFNVSPEPRDVGDTFTVDFTIANTGTAASGAFTTDFRLSTNDFISTFDEPLGTVAHGSIAAGSSVTLTRNFTLPDGTDPFWDTFDADGNYAVGMRIDSANAVSETNEGDNSNVGEFDDYDTLDIDDAYEDNNTRLTAYDISSNETDPLSDILGLGHSFNDDWYEIDITNNFQRLVVDLTHTHSDGNLNLAVYNAAGAFVASSTSLTNNEHIDTVLANSGTHYLRVYNPGADTGQSYDLEWDDLFGLPLTLTDSAVLIA